MNQQSSTVEPFQALKALGLDPSQLESLAKQGTLGGEGLGKRIFKLRFRHNGRRVVRYVGVDRGFIERVRGELKTLQNETRSRRRARQVAARARTCLRESKACLEPAFSDIGYYFQGHEIRRRRTDKQNDREERCSSQKCRLRSLIMEDRNKPNNDSPENRHPPNLPSQSQPMVQLHQRRIDDLAQSALDCSDPRQAVLRFAMAKSFSMGALVAENVETVLRGSSMTMREFRKNVVPMLSTAANLFKQGARCAQIDREFDQMIDEGPPLLPSAEAEK